ncbi:unnamed protein product [Paramecium sonneborni]|uniref:Uncharacterized protein n=1 Tax=Paramecium sonneborni TaxID=65129 RepID=A0A8S1RV70_9CILI|nr:unnamed protein product [Paramecium sonneborni]
MADSIFNFIQNKIVNDSQSSYLLRIIVKFTQLFSKNISHFHFNFFNFGHVLDLFCVYMIKQNQEEGNDEPFFGIQYRLRKINQNSYKDIIQIYLQLLYAYLLK